MPANYLTIAIRHLTRHKLFSLINIACLATGITFSLIIGSYVINEEEVDSGLRDVLNQYIIKSKWKEENMGPSNTTLGPLAKTMMDEYPNLVENYYRFDPVENTVSAGDKHFRTQISVGDTNLVSMYGFPLLYGNPRKAFQNNESAVVTEDFARKFFGKTDVIDSIITLQTSADGNKHDFLITAVLKNLPFNTVTSYTGKAYQVFLPMDVNQYFQGGDKADNWSNVFVVGMLQLKNGALPKDLEKPLSHTLEKYQPAFVKGNLTVELAPMINYHLKNNNNAVQRMVTALSLVAGFILLLAIINFVNINIGLSTYRLKEIGLRKVFGGMKFQLVTQFMVEALVLTFAAALISVVLYELLLPVFSQILNTNPDHFWQFSIDKLALLSILIISVGLAAGIYPAFVLSSSDTVPAIRGKTGSAKGGLVLRKTLLIIQFTLAAAVFISAITVSKQVSCFFNKDLGYNKEEVMILSSLPHQWDSTGVIRMEYFKTLLLQVTGVKNVSLSGDIPDGSPGGNSSIYPRSNGNFISTEIFGADADFAEVYGIQMREGIFLQNDNDSYAPGNIVLNESAVKALGWDSAVGRTIRLGGPDGLLETIVGVVKDFHFESLQKPIQPLLIAGLNEPFTRSYRYFSIKLNTSDVNNTITEIQKKCKVLFPDAGFDYSFLDEKFKSLYQSELQLRKAVEVGTVLNILIVSLGVFGVVAFTLTRRTKEIAVRKVLGADVRNIISIFLKEYAKLIFISTLIAWPLAYYILDKWLENYAYRIQQNIFSYLFVTAFILITIFSLITAQCFKTANSNPVNNLRVE
jgi:putative ABC transport system permease protein